LIEYHKVKNRKARTRRIGWMSTAAAACIIAFLFSLHTRESDHTINKAVANTYNIPSRSTDTSRANLPPSTIETAPPAKYARTISHYRLTIEQKQNRLDSLRKNDPDLYNSFKQASAALQSLYVRLQAKLPVSPDRDKILSLMIENLRIQENALNNQLALLMEMQATDHSNQSHNTNDL
jgi:hypothetical protein